LRTHNKQSTVFGFLQDSAVLSGFRLVHLLVLNEVAQITSTKQSPDFEENGIPYYFIQYQSILDRNPILGNKRNISTYITLLSGESKTHTYYYYPPLIRKVVRNTEGTKVALSFHKKGINFLTKGADKRECVCTDVRIYT
jgi:hypothetical protein